MAREIIRCPYCGDITPRTHWSKHDDLGDRYRVEFWCQICSKAFTVELLKGNDYSWTRDGYILIKVPGIGWIKEHKYIWEKAHGALPIGSVIHHINGDKTDNRLENLVAIPKKSHNPNLRNVNKRNGLIPSSNPSSVKYIP